MWRLTATLFLAWAASSACFGETQRLVVATWNLEWFPGGGPFAKGPAQDARIAAVGAELRRMNPDILLVQEVIERESLVQVLTNVPGMSLHVLSAFKGGAFGNRVQQVGIASKLKAKSAWAESWDPSWSGPPRGFAFASLEFGNGSLLMVYSLHLKSNRSSGVDDHQFNLAKREDAMRQLLTHAEDTAKTFTDATVTGVIVGGDFNTNRDNPEWASEGTLTWLDEAGFWDSWSGVPQPLRGSWMGSKDFAACTFDYLFLRGLGKQTAKLWPNDEATSDHHAVVCVIEVLNEESGGSGAQGGSAKPVANKAAE